MTSKKITLRDVDGTIPGRAALVTINLENPEARGGFTQDVFVEGEHNCTDPERSARGLWESIKNDWPNNTETVVMNERARYLMTARRQREMGLGIDDYSPAEYLEH